MRQTLRFQRVPQVDLQQPMTDLAVEIGSSLKEFGFVVVTGHGIRPAFLDGMENASRKLFALSELAKKRYETVYNGRKTGYTSFGVERAKDATVSDLKEFWHVMREGNTNPRNLFPDEVPEFERVALEFFKASEECAMKLLGIIGHFLGFEPKHLESMAERGNSTLRALHYPPLKGGEKGLRAGAHADINFITLLLPPSDAGLEILRPKGEWMPVIYPTGGLIVNAGDMLESYTKFRKKEGIRSTQHRVTNGPPGGPPSPKSRYSFPFFVHPRADVVVGERNGKPFTAAEFLEERLKENGVKA